MKRTLRPALSAVALLLAALAPVGLAAEDFRILTPYGGFVTNQYLDEEQNVDLDDTGGLGGLYFQWVNPELYQWNAFVYHCPDVTYSSLWGGHLIFDIYLGAGDTGKWSVGGGVEIIRLEMDAGSRIAPLSDFQLVNTVYVPFLRGGRYFHLDLPPLRLTAKPWAGAQAELVRGELEFVPPFPPNPVIEKIDDTEYFPIVGLSLIATLGYYGELQATYKATFNADRYLNTFSGMLNVFVSRRIGVSYKMMYMETTLGSNSLHLFGLAVVF